MLPQESGGVVDHKLIVYGTTNLRVVDLSTLPLHIAAHPQCEYSMQNEKNDQRTAPFIAYVYSLAERGQLSAIIPLVSFADICDSCGHDQRRLVVCLRC